MKPKALVHFEEGENVRVKRRTSSKTSMASSNAVNSDKARKSGCWYRSFGRSTPVELDFASTLRKFERAARVVRSVEVYKAMAKKVMSHMVKLARLSAGKANPAPPVGVAALGPHGVNIMAVLQGVQRQARRKAWRGIIIPVVITIYRGPQLHLRGHQDATDRPSC